MDTEIKVVVNSEYSGLRLDKFLAEQEELELSRSFIKKLIEEGKVTVNGLHRKASYKVRGGEIIAVLLPPPRELSVKPEEIPLDIVYEDEDLVVVNKKAGMVVHPAEGNWDGTLVNALLYHCQNLSGIGGVLRPGIVHRLDKDTSGLLVVAKNDLAHQSLAEQIKEKKAVREYWTIVHGYLKNKEGIIDLPIGRHPRDRQKMAVVSNGKTAQTVYKVLEEFNKGFTLIQAKLLTGRTHQIRVHFSYLGHPVLGDPKYGHQNNPFGVKRQMLHAIKLSFIHPRSGELLEFTAPLPEDFQRVLAKLRG
ncbi:RluA family pseudouridine synthase [Carboxydothermus hydrogenoformans]|uniref:Pseudouridine synthase n=1 Tax=Carboxydothermus hydrogenoformans (strain ATCC BAA-161 / DSM 6008 / Z-2901) TaxID=246194 RepID=Q3ABZ7_CARHZ|nr:RluA family pseudouridine synthase [Carboxydothermus hydrogenoformans]ABB15756.1 ribosomal large subunit pseudouridine synthase, RluA family [Carboxydothermus hydrogenoformans Z-2901]